MTPKNYLHICGLCTTAVLYYKICIMVTFIYLNQSKKSTNNVVLFKVFAISYRSKAATVANAKLTPSTVPNAIITSSK
jgi:hypothetical protein